MSLSIGIVGLPNVGKSTLFQIITKKQVDCSNYPFCTINPNVGIVAVPDERVDKLAEVVKAENKIYTTIEFIDIAGLIKGASKGEGLGNKFLANIRETDAIVYVLRCFKDETVANMAGESNPLKEKEILDAEMILKDLETIEKRLADKDIGKEKNVLLKAKEALDSGKILQELIWDDEEEKVLNSYQLLTLKPRLYLLNGKKQDVPSGINWPYLVVDALSGDNLENLIKESYKLLGLITFFTARHNNEVRAWTLKKGSKAPQAGGIVHTDFEQKFIKAEVINWQDLIDNNGFTQARQKGLIRTEGKDYIVQEGDVIEIKI